MSRLNDLENLVAFTVKVVYDQITLKMEAEIASETYITNYKSTRIYPRRLYSSSATL